MDAQLSCDLGHALQVWRTHPPPHISPLLRRSLRLDGLAVSPHCSAPSSPLVVGTERRQLFWWRGGRCNRSPTALHRRSNSHTARTLPPASERWPPDRGAERDITFSIRIKNCLIDRHRHPAPILKNPVWVLRLLRSGCWKRRLHMVCN